MCSIKIKKAKAVISKKKCQRTSKNQMKDRTNQFDPAIKNGKLKKRNQQSKFVYKCRGYQIELKTKTYTNAVYNKDT